jgi:hypothetical protein
VGESKTWVLFMLAPSSYRAPDNSVLVVQDGDYWLALFYHLGHHSMKNSEFRSGSTLLWSTTWSVNIINTTEVARHKLSSRSISVIERNMILLCFSILHCQIIQELHF